MLDGYAVLSKLQFFQISFFLKRLRALSNDSPSLILMIIITLKIPPLGVFNSFILRRDANVNKKSYKQK